MIIKCVVAAHNGMGEPDFFFCLVECSEEQYDNGDHYDRAEELADAEGYEGPKVTFDEKDGPDFLFERFAWESGTTVRV